VAIKGGRPNNRQVAAHLFLLDLTKAIEFYKAAFDARVLYVSAVPGGPVMHAHLSIGESSLLLSREHPGMENDLVEAPRRGIRLRAPESSGATGVVLEQYVPNVEGTFARAIAAGAEVRMPIQSTFFGDRYGQLTDPFGHVWGLATVEEEIAPEEVARRMMKMVPQFPERHARL
jgi:PhnB protein